ncbi:MAG: Imm10 family immunity protein [Verrucomicrobiota bacterium]
MEVRELKELMSGSDEDCLWVTLGFASELESCDVLHIVCDKKTDDQDRSYGMEGIYLERSDQSLGGYRGADKIEIKESEVLLELNDEGQKQLGFNGAVLFFYGKETEGAEGALRVFSEMPKYECGGVIKMIDQPWEKAQN